MGNFLSSSSDSDDEKDTKDVRRKRKADDDNSTSSTKTANLGTTDYIFEKLFEDGEGSDISVIAFDNEWKLHKIYLLQCNYFKSIFKGNWIESHNNYFPLVISDANITEQGLDTVFRILYKNETEIEMDKVVGVLASAFFLGLDGVIDRCEQIMYENLNSLNLLQFHEVSDTYGLGKLQKLTFDKFLKSFWQLMTNDTMIETISESLLARLISSPDLLIVGSEKDLYHLIRTWIYYRHCTNRVDRNLMKEDDFNAIISQFFHTQQTDAFFFKYFQLFQGLKLHHLFAKFNIYNTIHIDHLIPRALLQRLQSDLWKSVLHTNEDSYTLDVLSDELFNKHCMRHGKRFNGFEEKDLPTSLFNDSIEPHLSFQNRLLKLRQMANVKRKTALIYRVRITDCHANILFDSGIKKITFEPYDIAIIGQIPDPVSYPIAVHFQHMITSPLALPSSETSISKYLQRNPKQPPMPIIKQVTDPSPKFDRIDSDADD